MRGFITLLLLALSTALCAQQLAFYGDAMVNASQAEHRSYAASHFDSMFIERLSQPESFEDDLADLPFISVQYAPDAAFRIISWQVDEGEGTYRYKGYYQDAHHQWKGFDSRRGRDDYHTSRMIDITDWKGALVYKVLQVEDQYFLLTFKMVDSFTKVKTLEPLFTNEDQIYLGKEGMFDMKDRRNTTRIALVHSVDTNVKITYEEASKRFIFDNLLAVQGRIDGQGPTYVPDGSYRAFELKGDSWSYIDKLFDETNDGPLDVRRNRTKSDQLYNKKKKN